MVLSNDQPGYNNPRHLAYANKDRHLSTHLIADIGLFLVMDSEKAGQVVDRNLTTAIKIKNGWLKYDHRRSKQPLLALLWDVG